MSGNSGGWIGVDLDGTLAKYDKWISIEHIGDPVPAMAERVRAWLAEGRDVRIFTARVSHLYRHVGNPMADTEQQAARRVEATAARDAIHAWTEKHFGRALPVTALKDFAMIQVWDDRCVQVVPNTGERADGGLGVW